MRTLFFQESLLSSYFDPAKNKDDDKINTIKQTINYIKNTQFKKEDYAKDYLKRHIEEITKLDSNGIKTIIEHLIGYKMQTTLFDKDDRLILEKLPQLYHDLSEDTKHELLFIAE